MFEYKFEHSDEREGITMQLRRGQCPIKDFLLEI